MGASMLNISAYAEESGAGGASDGEDEDGAQRSTQPAAGWAGRRIRSRSNAMGASMLNIAAYAEQLGEGGDSEGEDEAGAAGAPRCMGIPELTQPASPRSPSRARLKAHGPSMLDMSAHIHPSVDSMASVQGCDDGSVTGQDDPERSVADGAEYAVLCWAPPRRFTAKEPSFEEPTSLQKLLPKPPGVPRGGLSEGFVAA